MAVEKFRSHVERWRVFELGEREQELGPLRARREVLPGEAVDMSGS
jgi:hypothetical protein